MLVPLCDSNGRKLHDANGKPVMCEQVTDDDATESAPAQRVPAKAATQPAEAAAPKRQTKGAK